MFEAGRRTSLQPTVKSGGSPVEETWNRRLAQGVRGIDDLVERGVLSADEARRLRRAAETHRVHVPNYYLSLIDPTDPNCPIRAQAIPSVEEMTERPWDVPDPIGDDVHRVGEALIHRYPDRVLMLPTHVCPMYCRYCFRKVGINDGPVRLHRAAEQALKYISEHTEVREVILSGGDPLMLSDGILESLRKAIEAIGHIDRLRIHSRTPVTFPDRMTEGLMDALDARIEVVMVTHFNHPTEITDRVIRGLRRFQETGIQLANQSVLLRGVNDDPRILAALCGQLVAIGVRPYYLHHLDAAPGTHHFRVSIEEGLAIYRSAISKLPVSDRPRYMLDMPGGGGKIPVDSAAVKAVDSTGLYRLTSPIDGHSILWQDPSLLQPVSVPHLV